MRLAISFLAAIILSGCVSFNNKVSIKENFPKQEISYSLTTWNNKQKIKLLPHQLIPIDYLEKHPEQKGLLIYHYLGTGKTYLSLGFAERNPKKKVILFIPRFLRGHWISNLKSYGVKNPARYEIITHKDGAKLINRDLSKTIVIVDESHRVIKNIESADFKIADTYSHAYLNIKKAHRTILLTGTPIFNSFTDIAYQINLLANKTLLPYNKEEFKVNFMKVNETRATLVGHLAQSNIMLTTMALSGMIFTLPFAAPWIIASGTVGAASIPLGLKYFYSTKTKPFRYFDVNKISGICSKYVSYYDFQQKDDQFYPTQKVHYPNVTYNDYQLDFLIRFADNQLTVSELAKMRRDYQDKVDHDYINLNSTRIQERMKKLPESGLEIGNLLYRNPKNPSKIIYPDKFMHALDLMKQTSGPVVVYSHFYHNGILLFKKYLDSKGYKGKYRILHPDASIKTYNEIIGAYNNGGVKFLLLHPTITEGISLKGTRQLHILESPYNRSFQKQIIGRAVRYKSHTHLPIKQRHVDVYIWKPEFGSMNLDHATSLRENWARNFYEVNYYGNRLLVDKNKEIKAHTPDTIAAKYMKSLDKHMRELEGLLKGYSIEKRGYRG